MAKLIYPTPTSLDGYIADETGSFDWATPDEEGFAFITDLLRPIGVYLWMQDVPDDGDLGDAGRHSWSDADQAGLRGSGLARIDVRQFLNPTTFSGRP